MTRGYPFRSTRGRQSPRGRRRLRPCQREGRFFRSIPKSIQSGHSGRQHIYGRADRMVCPLCGLEPSQPHVGHAESTDALKEAIAELAEQAEAAA